MRASPARDSTVRYVDYVTTYLRRRPLSHWGVAVLTCGGYGQVIVIWEKRKNEEGTRLYPHHHPIISLYHKEEEKLYREIIFPSFLLFFLSEPLDLSPAPPRPSGSYPARPEKRKKDGTTEHKLADV